MIGLSQEDQYRYDHGEEEEDDPNPLRYGCVAGALLLGFGYFIIRVIIYYLNQI